MSATSIVKSILEEVPECVAAGVIEIDSGLQLALQSSTPLPEHVKDLVAAATKDLFDGKNMRDIEDAFKVLRKTSSNERYFQLIMVESTNLLHFFSRLSSAQDIVIVAVCRQDANLAMARRAMKMIAAKEMI